MTVQEKAQHLSKNFGEYAPDVVDEIITAEVQWVSYINKKYNKDLIYDSGYWQSVKKELPNTKY